jgi:peptidoglycan/LPS O-acetylase OafA/YrhL
MVRSGSTGVSLFLVLSGFCLFLPFAGGKLDRFEMGTFMRRRCRRLLPAYFVTLAVLLVAVVATSGHIGLHRLTGWGFLAQLGTHLTLTHQLFPETFYGLNGAYWSLGLEWELYLALPLLIISARRFGLARTVGLAVGVNVAYCLALAAVSRAGLIDPQGSLATVVLPNFFLGRWAEFALGMVAASLYVTGRAAWWARRLVWIAALLVPVGFALSGEPIGHLVFGVIFFALVCTVVDREHPIARIFAWRPLVAVGVMSYSLYLVHQPLVEIGGHALGGRLSPLLVFVALVVMIPALLLVARLLFVTVEQHTITGGPADSRPWWSLRRARVRRRGVAG